MNSSPIFIIDPDIDDQELIELAWKDLKYPNRLYFFKNGEQVLEQLGKEKDAPFLIISELRLPKMSGIELKRTLLKDRESNFKSIPFVFLSSSISQAQIEEAYELCVNGVFEKKNSFDQLKDQLVDIAKYWAESLVP